eukprot:CAMPEP_0117465082 /NCGR_PEP_ID=MMETSP0784-20121206/4442_1 /TAXON_ID=39447 /ORGANISM="" /LENGTH=85 /DNA_ID=CAMNT_0005258979 /DNA_START=201 /DNA_END=458 /DNA_ORIENTATION=+
MSDACCGTKQSTIERRATEAEKINGVCDSTEDSEVLWETAFTVAVFIGGYLATLWLRYAAKLGGSRERHARLNVEVASSAMVARS